MKKLLSATVLFVTLTGAALNAQTARMVANIPFDFQTGKTVMTAGRYDFSRNGAVITVRAEDGKHAVMLLTSPVSRAEAPASPIVQFQRFGDEYFLSGIWTESTKDGLTV